MHSPTFSLSYRFCFFVFCFVCSQVVTQTVPLSMLFWLFFDLFPMSFVLRNLFDHIFPFMDNVQFLQKQLDLERFSVMVSDETPSSFLSHSFFGFFVRFFCFL